PERSGKSCITARCTKPVQPLQPHSGVGSDSTGTNRKFGARHEAGTSSIYRSRLARQPQYRVIGRATFFSNAYSQIDLIGAKPVPLASSTIGLSDSSRR